MSLHVLIVDDEKPIREVLRMVLEDDGYFITEAADGLSALEQIRTSPYALIVMTDHQMPHLDGPKLLTTILQDATMTRRHRVIYFTSVNRVLPQTVVADLHRLAAPLLHKPFDVEDLLATVHTITDEMVES